MHPDRRPSYWVEDARPGPGYLEAGGADHAYTRRTARWMAHDTDHPARLLRRHAIPAEGNTREGTSEAHRLRVG